MKSEVNQGFFSRLQVAFRVFCWILSGRMSFLFVVMKRQGFRTNEFEYDTRYRATPHEIIEMQQIVEDEIAKPEVEAGRNGAA